MFDLDGTITAYPEQMNNLMNHLSKAGCDVQILTGHKGIITPETIEQKKQLLKAHNAKYSKLTIVSSPDNNVADQKVAYMKTVNATGLVDNNKHNVKAARKAGFTALRVGK